MNKNNQFLDRVARKVARESFERQLRLDAHARWAKRQHAKRWALFLLIAAVAAGVTCLLT